MLKVSCINANASKRPFPIARHFSSAHFVCPSNDLTASYNEPILIRDVIRLSTTVES